METNRANDVIVEVLQKALVGQLKSLSNVNPRVIAEAISARVVFEKSYTNTKKDQITGKLIDQVVEMKNEMKKELDDETYSPLLLNFIRGQITSFDKILDILENSL